MSRRESRFDDLRAVTVTDGVASITLLVFALLIGGGLGLGLVFSGGGDTGGPPSANFSYSYLEQAQTMFVTMESGDPIQAKRIVFVHGETTATWATVAEVNNSTMIEPGASTALGKNTPFGAPITQRQPLVIKWVGENKTRRLGNWTA